jgi:outer membrane protein
VPCIRRNVLVLALVLLFPSAVQSEEHASPSSDKAEEPDWTFEIGAGGMVGPKFEGSRSYRFSAFPNFDIAYRDTVFISTEKGLGVNVFNMVGFQAGPLLKYKPARKEKDSGHLKGLGDVDGTFEGGGFISYNWMRFIRSRLEVRNGIKGHEGLVIDWDAKATLPLMENLFITAGPRLSASNRVYNTAYFGVDGDQSGRSGYRSHRAGAGLRRAGGEAVVTYRFSEALRLSTFFDYDRLLGDVADSPLVKGPGGSANQFAVGSTLTYSFDY